MPCFVNLPSIDGPNYHLDTPLASAVTGISTGPPGDFSLAAVKTSTPVSVTSKVCSTRMLALGRKYKMLIVLTKLSSPFAIHSYICPVIWPILFSGFSQRKDGLNCESHTGFAYPYCLIFAIMRYPRRGVEFSVNAMATPGGDDAAVSGFGILLNNTTKLSYWRARLHELNCLIQAFSRRFNYSD